MDGLPIYDGAASDGSTVDGNPFVRPPAGHHTVGSDHFEDISFNQPNRNVLGVAEAENFKIDVALIVQGRFSDAR